MSQKFFDVIIGRLRRIVPLINQEEYHVFIRLYMTKKHPDIMHDQSYGEIYNYIFWTQNV